VAIEWTTEQLSLCGVLSSPVSAEGSLLTRSRFLCCVFCSGVSVASSSVTRQSRFPARFRPCQAEAAAVVAACGHRLHEIFEM